MRRAPTKRFFDQGVKIEAGGNAGRYFYARDHLGSIRELTDSGGAVRARYDYDPFGRRTLLAGDVEADFGLAGMFWSPEAELAVTRFRIYDPELGRWLSRDPLGMAEARQGPNLYAYVANNPLNLVDPLGLCCEKEEKALDDLKEIIERLCKAFDYVENIADPEENLTPAAEACALTRQKYAPTLSSLALDHFLCVAKGCSSPKPCPKPADCRYINLGSIRALACDNGETKFF